MKRLLPYLLLLLAFMAAAATITTERLQVNTADCIACGTCESVCPTGAIAVTGNYAVIDQKECIQCMQCLDACPTGAIVTVIDTVRTDSLRVTPNGPQPEPPARVVTPPTVWHNACTGCGDCTRFCPTGAITLHDGKAFIDKTKCIDCKQCVRTCTYGAVR